MYKFCISFVCVLLLSGCSYPNSRVERLGNAIGLTVSVGVCDIVNALACYKPSDNSTVVTVEGLSYSDAELLCVLKHEARHKWQDDNNLIVFDAAGSIVNSDWLEADAYTNGCSL